MQNVCGLPKCYICGTAIFHLITQRLCYQRYITALDALTPYTSACGVCRLRACYTPQGYKTPTAEKARPVRASTTTPTSAQQGSAPLSSSAPKAFYGKSRQAAWQLEDNSPSPSNTTTISSSDSSNSKK